MEKSCKEGLLNVDMLCFPHLVFLDFIIFCFLQISADCGALELEKVFELIVEGENLPAYLERELKVSAIHSYRQENMYAVVLSD